MKSTSFVFAWVFVLLSVTTNYLYSQSPQGFNYQAIVRNGSGNPIANQNVSIRLTLQSSSGIEYFKESKTVSTNPQGVLNYLVGSGTLISGSFSAVPWNTGDILVNVEIDPNGGTSYTQMGSPSKLQSVPYALYAENTKEVVSQASASDEDPIFVVKNKAGQIVFAVYQTGVRVYVEDSQIAKGVRGGFAIGGLTNQSKDQQEYFRITADSARLYVKEFPTGKGVRGGFAIGGLTNQSKTVVSRNLMFVAPDSTRFWVNENVTKGARGGFAIGGLTNQSKGTSNQYLQLTPDNYFIGQNSGHSINNGKYNSVFGYYAGSDLFNGLNNTILGNKAGEKTKDGSSNVFIGNYAGNENIWGSQNIFIGDSAGRMVTSSGSIIIGNSAGRKATTLYKAVFIGNEAGANDASGNPNTFIGNQAGYSNIEGYQNLFLGNSSGYSNTSGFSNLFIGNWAGYSNTTGGQNLFIGEMAGYKNTTSGGNTFIGFFSAYNNTDGHGNTFIGNYSGNANTTGSNNTFMGNGTGSLNTTGEENVFIGQNAGLNNTTGSFNTFVGKQTGLSNIDGNGNTYLGQFAGYYKKTGNSNVFLGVGAGASNINGSGNVFVGSGAGADEPGSNKLYISNANVDSTQALIYGKFDKKTLKMNSTVTIGNFYSLDKQSISVYSSYTITPTKSYALLTSSSATTLNTTTAIQDGSVEGQVLILMGTSDTNTITINDDANTILGANRTLGLNDTMMLIWNGSDWVEISYSNN